MMVFVTLYSRSGFPPLIYVQGSFLVISLLELSLVTSQMHDHWVFFLFLEVLVREPMVLPSSWLLSMLREDIWDRGGLYFLCQKGGGDLEVDG